MARWIVYRRFKRRSGKPEDRWTLLAKRIASKAALEVANEAIQIHGATVT